MLRRAGTLTPRRCARRSAGPSWKWRRCKARQRREHEAKKTRVERWAEASGNAGLAGRELPGSAGAGRGPAGDGRGPRSSGRRGWRAGWTRCGPGRSWTFCSAWTPGPRAAPSAPAPVPPGTSPSPTPRTGIRGGPREPGPAGGPLAGVIPPGFAGHVTLTIPAATGDPRGGPARGTGRDRARRPGPGPGSGRRRGPQPPVTWHVTVTDQHGHAVGHGCARPVDTPETGRARPARRARVRGHSRRARRTPAGPGTWRLGRRAARDLLLTIEPLPGGDCDHRHQARGHDPGMLLRHLTEVRHATCTGPGCRPGPPGRATSSTTPPMTRAGGPACATATRSAGRTTG